MLRSVRKLEPGMALVVKDGRIAQRFRFYDPRFDQEFVDWPEGDAIVQVRKYLTRAVDRQLMSDVPLGAFLSGGLDSSSVVALAQRRIEPDKLQCFTIGFKSKEAQIEGMADDLPYAQRVAEHLGVDLHTIWVGPEMVDELAKMVFYLDEPQADPAPINALFISQLARKQGIKVLLSGAGGDDIFTGYRRHYALLREPLWSWLPHPLREALRSVSSHVRPTTELRRRLAKAFRYADLDGDQRILSYFHWTPPDLLAGVFSPALRALRSPDLAGPVPDALASLPSNVAALNRMLYLEIKFFLTDHNLNYVDKVSMASGVEVRVPMLDPELMALAARLPLQLKQRGRARQVDPAQGDGAVPAARRDLADEGRLRRAAASLAAQRPAADRGRRALGPLAQRARPVRPEGRRTSWSRRTGSAGGRGLLDLRDDLHRALVPHVRRPRAAVGELTASESAQSRSNEAGPVRMNSRKATTLGTAASASIPMPPSTAAKRQTARSGAASSRVGWSRSMWATDMATSRIRLRLFEEVVDMSTEVADAEAEFPRGTSGR